MRILESSEVTIYDPTDEVVFYCMEHFTVKNPEYARRLRMNKWLGDTPEYLDLYKKRGDHLILPFGAYKGLENYLWMNDLLDYVDLIEKDFAFHDPVDYQAECRSMIIRQWLSAGCCRKAMAFCSLRPDREKRRWALP